MCDEDTIKQKTVERIVNLMEKKRVSTIELATDLSLAKNVVSEWKSGRIKPSIEIIVRLADYFGVSTDYLLKGEERGNNSENGKEDEEMEENLSKALNKEYEDFDYVVIKGLHDYFSGISIDDYLLGSLSSNTGINKDRLKSFYVNTKIYVEFDNPEFYPPAALQRGLLKNEFGTICSPKYDEFKEMMGEKNYSITHGIERKSCINLLKKLGKIDEIEKFNRTHSDYVTREEFNEINSKLDKLISIMQNNSMESGKENPTNEASDA